MRKKHLKGERRQRIQKAMNVTTTIVTIRPSVLSRDSTGDANTSKM